MRPTGNATLYGSLWSENLNLKVSGSAVVSYSSQALALANQASNYTSLADCNQVQPGVGNCPS